MDTIAISESEVAAARSLRLKFFQFWSTAQGEPREIYDRFIAMTPVAPEVGRREVATNPGPGVWSEPSGSKPGKAILFIHGGGYGLGHASPYFGLTSQIAARTQVAIFALEYPLAPEAAVPVALDLAVRTLVNLTAQFDSVAVMGDSAGGGLATATVLAAQKEGVRVSSLVTFSPWTDLSLSGDSAGDFAVGDPLLDVAYLRASAAAYVGNASVTDPRASPLFTTDPHLPPTLIQVGSDEVLLDDSRRLAAAASAAASEVTLEQWQGMHHVFQLNVAELASARKALDHAAAFVTRHWSS